MRDINNKFSVRYYLNLVLMDTEDRRYFKQQEVTLWRKSDKSRLLLHNPHHPQTLSHPSEPPAQRQQTIVNEDNTGSAISPLHQENSHQQGPLHVEVENHKPAEMEEDKSEEITNKMSSTY